MLKQLKYPFFLFYYLSAIAILSLNSQNAEFYKSEKIPVTVFKSDLDTISFKNLNQSDQLFVPLKELPKTDNVGALFWIKLDFRQEYEQLQNDTVWYLRFRGFGYCSLFFSENGRIEEKKLGLFQKTIERESVLYNSGIPFNSNSLIDKKFLYLKIKGLISIDPLKSFQFHYVSKKNEELKTKLYSWNDLKTLIPKYLFSGVCLVLFILTLFFYLLSRKREFIYYAFYIFWLFVYLNGNVFRTNNIFFGGNNLFSYSFQQIAQVFINLCYLLFVKHYLTTNSNYPKLHRILQFVIYILIVIIILDVNFLLFENIVMHVNMMNIQRLIMALFGICGMLYLAFNAKNKLAYFVVIGSFLYMSGALGLLFLKNPLFMIFGAFLEIIIFTLGLVYKINQEQQEKLYFQKASFISNNKALRAQMNPHFIFNSLTSIQHLIVSDKKEKAMQYLNKFSALTRGVLESTMESTIILSEEITLLKKYIDLEALRFDANFEYSISISNTIDVDAVEIPMFIVQPFVENAIKHGLLHKKEGAKNIKIHFDKTDAHIICTVEDNGKGRQRSLENKTKYQDTTKSRGIKVTTQRLQLLNPSENNPITIIDKHNEQNHSTGTRVIIKIPTEL
ncbi:hypothetical protein BTO06_07140 [Tenacibaculum sp. SZ-18]|uniref:sensor histidine kinase n=1 Tax=Tenacibaculum sp. SZ-18 TaxID=754423 RepID=UPI000C2D5664|nr:histidine kinase [Tenacibaculum sp. SZ-18]AUC14925.1 hypothetical protein BTO06_07140 [Tenacibaculum sp. SZ-18]